MNIAKYLLGTLIAFLCTACMANPSGAERITAQEAKARMEKNPQAIVLDVRTEAEYRSGHIKGAVLLPLDRLEAEALAVLPNKEAEILIYCRSGRRSADAGEILGALGYKNIADFGGILLWPYEVVTEP
ncbi:MAG: rhodanese-like domain-containing protein [Selenomonadales bacterium]|nr:rhodanese-like domain-containing protein [Selenomonadales bacterium]